MDREIQDKYEEAEAYLKEMVDALQNDNLFIRRYSAFMASADSTLDYIKNRYKGKKNSNHEEFDKWFNSPKIRWDEELTHLTRARGYIIHFAHIPMGATRGIGYGMDAIFVTEEQAAKQANDSGKATNRGSNEIELYVPPANPPIETIGRWLIDEYIYMKYTDKQGRTRDNLSFIPVLRNRYSISYPGTGGNRVDIISICTAYLAKIKNIMNTCQQKWP